MMTRLIRERVQPWPRRRVSLPVVSAFATAFGAILATLRLTATSTLVAACEGAAAAFVLTAVGVLLCGMRQGASKPSAQAKLNRPYDNP